MLLTGVCFLFSQVDTECKNSNHPVELVSEKGAEFLSYHPQGLGVSAHAKQACERTILLPSCGF